MQECHAVVTKIIRKLNVKIHQFRKKSKEVGYALKCNRSTLYEQLTWLLCVFICIYRSHSRRNKTAPYSLYCYNEVSSQVAVYSKLALHYAFNTKISLIWCLCLTLDQLQSQELKIILLFLSLVLTQIWPRFGVNPTAPCQCTKDLLIPVEIFW